jgi:hypothetical protein
MHNKWMSGVTRYNIFLLLFVFDPISLLNIYPFVGAQICRGGTGKLAQILLRADIFRRHGGRLQGLVQETLQPSGWLGSPTARPPAATKLYQGSSPGEVLGDLDGHRTP